MTKLQAMAWGCVIVLMAVPARAETPSPAESERIGNLIRQLGSPDFAEREAAQERLIEFGPAAREALEAAAQHRDAEIALRSSEAIQWLDTWRAVPSLRPHVAWRHEVNDWVIGEIGVDERTVLLVTNGKAIGLDARNGKQKFEHSIEYHHMARREVACADGVMAFAHQYDQLIALDSRDGSVRWQREGHYGWNSPVAAGNRIYIGGLGGPPNEPHANTLYALEARNGEVTWTHEFRNGVGKPLIDSQTGSLYVVAAERDAVNKRLHCLDLSDGRLNWSVAVPHFHSLALVADEKRIYYRSGEGTVLIFDRADGQRSGELKLPPSPPQPSGEAALVPGPGFFFSTAQITDGRFALHNGRLYLTTVNRVGGFSLGEPKPLFVRSLRLDRRRQTRNHQMAVRNMIQSDTRQMRSQQLPTRLLAPVAYGDRFYVGCHDGLVVLNAATGKPMAKYIGAGMVVARPVIRGDTMYLVTSSLEDGQAEVVAIDLKPIAEADTP